MKRFPARVEELRLTLVLQTVTRDYPQKPLSVFRDKELRKDDRKRRLSPTGGDSGNDAVYLFPRADPRTKLCHFPLVLTELHLLPVPLHLFDQLSPVFILTLP
jgi:hypothetical protein